MKINFFLFLSVTFSIQIQAQSICGTANEGGTVTMTAPAGNVFTSITFASYGTPNGSCGSFTIGTCNASNSVSIVQTALIGQNSASIGANNTVFGDPCVGTGKRLYIEATYSTSLPLKLLSFAGTENGNQNMLHWTTTDEVSTKAFVIERSSNGLSFSGIATVNANNHSGENNYSYSDNRLNAVNIFYRLKMIDIDGRFTYSPVIRLEENPDQQWTVYPSPTPGIITLKGLKGMGWVEIANMQGSILQKISVTDQVLTINITNYPAGIYFVRYSYNQKIRYQKIIKQ